MIGLFSLLLIQSALPSGSAPGIGVSVEPPPTALSVTEGEGLFRCQLMADDGAALAFDIRNGGGRGYVDPRTSEVKTTPDEVEILEKGTQLFRNYGFQEFDDLRYEGHSDAADARFGKRVRLQLERTDDPRRGDSKRFAILVQAQWDWMPLTKAVGFCDLTINKQSPLSIEETRKFLKL